MTYFDDYVETNIYSDLMDILSARMSVWMRLIKSGPKKINLRIIDYERKQRHQSIKIFHFWVFHCFCCSRTIYLVVDIEDEGQSEI